MHRTYIIINDDLPRGPYRNVKRDREQQPTSQTLTTLYIELSKRT